MVLPELVCVPNPAPGRSFSADQKKTGRAVGDVDLLIPTTLVA